MTSASPIIALLALEHLRAVSETYPDHVAGIAATRTQDGDHAALQKIAAGCTDLARQLGQPHLPAQRIDILRQVGTEAALVALGMMYQPGESPDALAQRAWTAAKSDLEGCDLAVLCADHHRAMGRVRDTLLAWRTPFSQTVRMDAAAARREIYSLAPRLVVIAGICLLSAASQAAAA